VQPEESLGISDKAKPTVVTDGSEEGVLAAPKAFDVQVNVAPYGNFK